MKNKLWLFVQGSVFLVASNICIKAINFFLLPLYTKNLSPSMLGVSDSISTFTGILFPLLVLGLDSAYSAFYFDKTDKKRAEKVFSTIGIILTLIGIIPMIMCVFSKQLSLLLFKDAGYDIVVMTALIGVTFNLWNLPFSLELRLRNKMGLFGIASVIASLTMIGLNILFVSVMKLGEIALILSSTIVALEYLFLYAVFSGNRFNQKYFDYKLLKKMIHFSLPLVPSVLMAWVLALSDRYILLHYYGNDAVGLYGIGARFVTLLNVVISAVSTAYTTFAFSSKDDENAKSQYYYVFNVVSLILLGVAFTIAIFSKEIITIMTDPAYHGSHVIIRDMMFGQVFYAMSTIVSYGIVFEKKSVYSLISVSSGAVVNLILNFIFIPMFGLRAAALTTLIGYLVSLGFSYHYSEKLYPCDYGITKLMVTCTGTYLISWVALQTTTMIRFVIWAAIVMCILIIYKDIVYNIKHFAMSSLKSFGKKAGNTDEIK